MLLAAPLAAMTAAGFWKPSPKRLVYSGTFTINKSIMEKIRPSQTAFNAQTDRLLKELYLEYLPPSNFMGPSFQSVALEYDKQILASGR